MLVVNIILKRDLAHLLVQNSMVSSIVIQH